MIELPRIEKTEDIENGVRLSLLVPAELRYFPGHFPQHPVLPGVVQLRWAAEYSRQYDLANSQLSGVEKLKFQRIISSDYHVTLALTALKPQVVHFQFTSEHGQHSSGKLIFE